MYKKILLALSFLIIPVLTVAGCAINAKGDEVSLDHEFTLPVGQTISLPSENLAVKFVKVVNDSRAPKGVQAIWAGEAKFQLQITQNGIVTIVTLTEKGGMSGYSEYLFNQFLISFQLLPYPEVNKQPGDEDYKLLMNIAKSNTPSTLGPSVGALIDNGAVVVGEVRSVTVMPTGYPWEIQVLINSTQDLGNLPNPIGDKVGQVTTFRTEENGDLLKVGQFITANVKLTGDVELGTFLNIYGIK